MDNDRKLEFVRSSANLQLVPLLNDSALFITISLLRIARIYLL